jgi:hypothetical protein
LWRVFFERLFLNADHSSTQNCESPFWASN